MVDDYDDLQQKGRVFLEMLRREGLRVLSPRERAHFRSICFEQAFNNPDPRFRALFRYHMVQPLPRLGDWREIAPFVIHQERLPSPDQSSK